MTEKEVWKVCRNAGGMGLRSAIVHLHIRALDRAYLIDRLTKPHEGTKLTAFASRKDAVTWLRRLTVYGGYEHYVILRCTATNVRRLRRPTLPNLFDMVSLRVVVQYWKRPSALLRRSRWWDTPKGSVACDAIKPLEVCHDHS